MCARTDATAGAERLRGLLARMRHLQDKRKSQDTDTFQDTLAVVTAHHKNLVDQVYAKLDQLMKSPSVRVLLRCTQPAHVVMLAATFLMFSSLLQLSTTHSVSPFTNLAYLASFSLHFGTQFWMTFVSGLALFFNLPRHDFGAVQKVLFPKYFSINSALSLVTLISFTNLHHLPTMHTPELVQVTALSTCFLLELCVRLYAVPPVLHLISAKTEIEIAAGVGREVGQFLPGPLVSCPHFQQLHRRFRRLHTLVAVGNIAAMACTSLHLYYLSNNWICHTTLQSPIRHRLFVAANCYLYQQLI